MKHSQKLLEQEDYVQLIRSIPYLLAGLEGSTNGKEITSITVQQARLSGFRVVIRARGADNGGDTVCVVGFTSAADPGTALLFAESGYRENVIRWQVDRFAKSVSDNGSSKDEPVRLTIKD